MLDVADDADHDPRTGTADDLLLIARNAAVERDALADHVAGAGPVLPRHRLAHHDDSLARLDVVRIEVAPGEERNAQRGKVSGRCRTRLGLVTLSVGTRMIFDLDAAAVVVVA